MNSEHKKEIKEFTLVYLGPTHFWNFYPWAYLILTEKKLVIKPFFKRYSILLENIEMVSSEEKLVSRVPLGFSAISKWLKITHHDQECKKEIYFTSVNFNAWLGVFESKGIRIEDNLGLRSFDNSQFKSEKSINIPMVIFAYLAMVWVFLIIVLDNLGLASLVKSRIEIWGLYFFLIGLSFSMIRILMYKLKKSRGHDT